MAVRNYNAGEVSLTIGDHIVGGYADGTFVSLEREEQSFTKVTGADGHTSRAKSNNRSGSLTLTLLHTSPSNEVLSSWLSQDELSSDGIFSVLLKDNSNESRFFSSTGWVQGLPTIEYGKEVGNRQWVIDLADIEFNVAGNVGFGT